VLFVVEARARGRREYQRHPVKATEGHWPKLRGSHVRVRRALEVGGVAGPDSLLLFPELEGAERFSLNLVGMPSTDGITAVVGNANDMTTFEDETFDLVMSNATLEHDRYFWLSVSEMRRVLAPGGLLIIGTPGYTKDHERDHGLSTHTYRVHYRFDYYRFSDQTFRDVFFDDMDRVDVQAILAPPRIIGGCPVARRSSDGGPSGLVRSA
jgi:SAM-dependent methyltransferase